MKVALLTDGVWPDSIGGMQKHSYYLAKYLSKRGVSVDVFTSVKLTGEGIESGNGDKSGEQLVRIINVERPAARRFPGHYLWESFHFSKKIYQRLAPKIEHYDVIYAQGLAGWYILKNSSHNVPVVLNFHGLNMFQKARSLRVKMEQAMFRPFVKDMLVKSDYVQSLGGRLTSILIENGVSREKIFELGIGIERDWVSPAQPKEKSDKTFVFIGRYDKVKGIDELNSAIRSLLQNYKFHFDFIGPIPETSQIQSEQISYHGEVRDAERIKYILKGSDFLILPSHSEGMPTVILEAMACGNGIIATDVGAVSELVSSENGILIPPFDKEALYNALVTAIEMDDAHTAAMKQSSAELVNTKFLWDGLIDDMLSFFQKIKFEKRLCLIE